MVKMLQTCDIKFGTGQNELGLGSSCLYVARSGVWAWLRHDCMECDSGNMLRSLGEMHGAETNHPTLHYTDGQ